MHIATIIGYIPSAALLFLVVLNFTSTCALKWELPVSLVAFVGYTIAITLVLRKRGFIGKRGQ